MEGPLKRLPGIEKFRNARARMVERDVEQAGVTEARVLEALRAVPRHAFADKALEFQAYGGHALPIGHGQTLSQPYIVGRMTELLELTGDETVFEAGTGSGYQASVLALLAKRVYSVERLPELARRANRVLSDLGLANVLVAAGDAYHGWERYAPFDRVIVTASCDAIPEPLLDQLADPGILVAPVAAGADGKSQELVVVRRAGGVDTRIRAGECRFVPFIATQDPDADPERESRASTSL